MASSWWQLGEGYGYPGSELQVSHVTCPFCMETGKFSLAYHAEKRKPNSDKVLNFDTLRCESCAGFVMVMWSASEHGFMNSLWDFKVLPWPMRLDKFPEHWPADVGRYWLQAHRSLRDANYDAAAVMARSALQLMVRREGATPASLKAEIDELVKTGKLPPLMGEWAHEVRELGNDSAHPAPGQTETSAQDAGDVVEFLDNVANYLLTMPHQIQLYRSRRAGSPKQ